MNRKTIDKDIFLSNIIGRNCYNIYSINNNFKFNPKAFYSFIFDYDPQIIYKCNQLGFLYISSRVVLRLKISTENTSQIEHNQNSYTLSRYFVDDDFNSIYKISKTISKTSRFYKDIKIRKYAKKIYDNWINNSLLNNYANDYIFMRRSEDKKIIGYLTLKKKGLNYVIDLLGVAEQHQRKGVGTIMLNYMIQKYKKFNILVGTECENIPALNFYLQNKFKIISYQLVYHRYT